MAEGLSATAANALLTSLGSTYTWAQLHTGPPGASGTANVAVEADRVQVTWAAPSGGVMSTSTVTLWTSVAASEDYTHVTMWTVASGGTFGFSGVVVANPVNVGNNFSIAVGDIDVSLVLAS